MSAQTAELRVCMLLWVHMCVCMCTTRAHTQRTLIHTHVLAHAHSVYVHYGGEYGTSTVIHENNSFLYPPLLQPLT